MREGVAVFAPSTRVGLHQRLAAAAVRRVLTGWRVGSLVVELPDGSTWEVGNRLVRPVTVTVRDWAFFWRVAVGDDIGLGESYVAGEWDCDDLVDFFRLAIGNRPAERRRALPLGLAAGAHRLLRR